MGDRSKNLEEALSRLKVLEGCSVEAVSAVVRSVPQGNWDGDPCGDFLNACVRIRTSLPAEVLLSAVKGIERDMGRTSVEMDSSLRGGERLYHDRPIDIDILLYGDMLIDTPSLQVPHPRMHEREWVMGPLQEILQ